ncbi:MAG: GNAT family N-acetyltransferase [Methylacidiphilales bacterium]|nr:GNAT family N-acetyltransferase [Candidatus Methylacidiphilales bacterium]
MYKPDWIRFSWELKSLPAKEPKLNGGFVIRKAEEDEREEVYNVVERSYLAELAWGIASLERLAELKEAILKGMGEKDFRVLIVEDGKRIIGASALLTDPTAPRQLVSGICVMEEYRCRGAGTALLWQSLKLLADEGLDTASVVTRSNVPACKFLYTKFTSRRERVEEMPVLKQFA